MAGPKIFLDYDQAALDAAYDQLAYAPNRDQVLARYAAASEAMRARLGEPQRLAYGPSEVERLDFYSARTARAPIEIFLHGGAWRRGRARDYGFPAEMFNAHGLHYAALDFVAVEAAPDGLRTMADQVRRAIAWLHAHAAEFGGDPDRLYLTGHSSGAHLAAVLLTTDWTTQHGLPRDLVKGGLCVSGMYDLLPVSLSARSRYVPFDDRVIESLSPRRHVSRLAAALVVAHGSLETPEFQRQAQDFAAAVAGAGKPVESLRLEGYNHFEMLETYGSPDGVLGRAALARAHAQAP
ncbi:MAG TPA: alpha/beta hydrolase [Alphaproteobacteria bacterium]|nr:alpha/beta hydrolase [Alphaproteobacteria bacterium]